MAPHPDGHPRAWPAQPFMTAHGVGPRWTSLSPKSPTSSRAAAVKAYGLGGTARALTASLRRLVCLIPRSAVCPTESKMEPQITQNTQRAAVAYRPRTMRLISCVRRVGQVNPVRAGLHLRVLRDLRFHFPCLLPAQPFQFVDASRRSRSPVVFKAAFVVASSKDVDGRPPPAMTVDLVCER
jgi:hypothetical protein